MKIIDLSRFITSDMPVYPGTERPVIKTVCDIDKVGFFEKKIAFYSHTGTHIDAPAHIIKGAKTLDMLSLEHFYGKGFLFDFSLEKSGVIDIKDLEPHKSEMENAEFLLIRTGWERYWGYEKYFSGYPVLSGDAAEWLAKFFLKGIGMDTISADKENSADFKIHKIFLKKEILIIENLCNLKSLINEKRFMFSSFPLKFQNADGSPVRAAGYIM